MSESVGGAAVDTRAPKKSGRKPRNLYDFLVKLGRASRAGVTDRFPQAVDSGDRPVLGDARDKESARGGFCWSQPYQCSICRSSQAGFYSCRRHCARTDDAAHRATAPVERQRVPLCAMRDAGITSLALHRIRHLFLLRALARRLCGHSVWIGKTIQHRVDFAPN
jgi:hypothetical protein